MILALKHVKYAYCKEMVPIKRGHVSGSAHVRCGHVSGSAHVRCGHVSGAAHVRCGHVSGAAHVRCGHVSGVSVARQTVGTCRRPPCAAPDAARVGGQEGGRGRWGWLGAHHASSPIVSRHPPAPPATPSGRGRNGGRRWM